MDIHCFQLAEMALSAWLATLALEFLMETGHSMFTDSVLGYPVRRILVLGFFISLFTTIITATIVKKLKNEWQGSQLALSASYLLGVAGYYSYVTLLLLKVVRT